MSDCESPLVSIGLPVFNGEAHISRALKSLLNQTYRNIEVVISDNCSSDSTVSICREIADRDSRVRVFVQTENVGPVNNFSYVLSMSRGEYFMWAAHDDFWDEGWVMAAIDAFDDVVVMATGDIVGVDCNGNNLSLPLRFEFLGNRVMRQLRYFLANESEGKANIIYSMFRSSVLKKFKFPGLDGFHGFDMHLVFFVLGQGSCSYVSHRSLYKMVPLVDQRRAGNDLFNLLSASVMAIRYLVRYLLYCNGLVSRLGVTLLLIPKIVIYFYGRLGSFIKRS